MKWLEIIELRTTSRNSDSTEKQIINLVNQFKSERCECTIKVYRNGIVDTDFSIHLQHNSQVDGSFISSLSEQIVSVLKEFGLTNYTKWIPRNSSKDEEYEG